MSRVRGISTALLADLWLCVCVFSIRLSKRQQLRCIWNDFNSCDHFVVANLELRRLVIRMENISNISYLNILFQCGTPIKQISALPIAFSTIYVCLLLMHDIL